MRSVKDDIKFSKLFKNHKNYNNTNEIGPITVLMKLVAKITPYEDEKDIY